MREAGRDNTTGRHTATNDRDEALFRSLQRKKRARRRRVIRTVIIIVLLAALGLTGAVYYLRRRVQKSIVSNDDVSSAKAERGSVSTTVSGSGTLENVDEEEIKIPGGVVIDEIPVKANDKVKAGDVIAAIDKSSVLSAMETLQSDLETLDKSIYDARGNEVKNYISFGVEGTILKVYGEMGQKGSDVMAEHGCLAEITLENGTVLKVSETSGTVFSVFISEGDAVFVNASLFSVSDVETMGEYGALVLRHQKIEDQLAQLFQMYRDGYVPAPADGCVAGTDETLVKKLSAGVCEEGGTRLVYTALSRDKSELSNPVPIEPGFSDGETLEILSGLSEGDTVWYKTFDTPEYSVPKSRSSGGLGSLLGGGIRDRACKARAIQQPAGDGALIISRGFYFHFTIRSS